MAFQTKCTECGGDVYLVAYSAEVQEGDIPIRKDGFEIGSGHTHTHDEWVECGDCGLRQPLGYTEEAP
jgi:hypothetical protein